MQYLRKSFSVQGPGKIDCCEACVYKRGPHSVDCKNVKLPFPNAIDDAVDSGDFECMEDANDRARARGPQLAPGQSVEEFCQLYGLFG